jgi:hypothetical protein
MTLERRDPLPPGRYWIDTFDEKIDVFESWASSSGAVVDQREQFAGPRSSTSLPEKKGVWFLFHTSSPASFPQKDLGFPTIADSNVKTKADTVQRPETPTAFGMLSDFFSGDVAPLLVVGAGLALASSSKKNNNDLLALGLLALLVTGKLALPSSSARRAPATARAQQHKPVTAKVRVLRQAKR